MENLRFIVLVAICVLAYVSAAIARCPPPICGGLLENSDSLDDLFE